MAKRHAINRRLAKPFADELDRLILANNQTAVTRGGRKRTASSKTREDRASFYHLMFRELLDLGFRLQSPENLREKHIAALARYWEDSGHAARTLHTRMSMVRVFCRWIGKPDMMRPVRAYFSDQERLTRVTARKESLSWEGKGHLVEGVLRLAGAIDARFAVLLALQHEFGLRTKESIEMRPMLADRGDHLVVSDGTKGGLPRNVPILSARQREVLDEAHEYAKVNRSGRMRWPNRTWSQSQDRFYYCMGQLGATQSGELGVTAHGLRHGFAQRDYKQQTGLPTPVEGGALGRIDRNTHREASLSVSLKLGHRRPEVVNFYYGSYGHALREPRKPLYF